MLPKILQTGALVKGNDGINASVVNAELPDNKFMVDRGDHYAIMTINPKKK